MFKVNPASFNSVFVLPCEVVDKHLRLAGSVQLKVLLWFYRNASTLTDIDGLVSLLGLPKADIIDAVQYWLENGILLESESVAVLAPSKNNEETEVRTLQAKENNETLSAESSCFNEEKKTKVKKELPEIQAVKPSMSQIAARITECMEIRQLFLDTQKIFGRTIGYDVQSCLLMLHDFYGLPVEVILMLCEYARSNGKQNSMDYILKVGKIWAENEIDSFEKASEQIEYLEKSGQVWSKLRVLAGISTPRPTLSQQKFLNVWCGEWNFSIEMIYLAYEEMADNTGKLSFSYMNKILLSWHDSGVKTPDDFEKMRDKRKSELEEIAYKRKSTKSENSFKNGAPAEKRKNAEVSYDIEEAERRALQEPIVYKRRGES